MSALIYCHPRMNYRDYLAVCYDAGMKAATDPDGQECFVKPPRAKKKSPVESFAKPFSKLLTWRKKQ